MKELLEKIAQDAFKDEIVKIAEKTMTLPTTHIKGKLPKTESEKRFFSQTPEQQSTAAQKYYDTTSKRMLSHGIDTTGLGSYVNKRVSEGRVRNLKAGF